MDFIAVNGVAGSLKSIPEGLAPGSDVANLSIFGYNPSKYFSGRAPIEAVYRGISLGPKDVAFRCNLVTLEFRNSKNNDKTLMEDYSAGHISTKEAGSMIRHINNKLGNKDICFYPGMSYRHLMVWKNGKHRMKCTPPHDIPGKIIADYLPSGEGGRVLRMLMEQSRDLLLSHPVNRKRIQQGLPPANSLWFWGQGRRLSIPLFRKKYGLRGAVISAVDLIKGLGLCAGFDILNVKGATGYLDTNYTGKARTALNALKKFDIIYLHVEAPDEAGHIGDIKAKIQAIEDFDSKVVGTVLKGLQKTGDCSILLVPDHATPISVKSHTAEAVPFAIYRSGDHKVQEATTGIKSFSENICRAKNALSFEQGYKLMDYFIKK